MIINNAPQNEAVLSNVGEIGEFRIRNSAKAFNILSSGLYANKIRAIIRELSCNAVDSHVAAGKADVPFDVHLPNALDPHFSIRDYGTGLSHDQVVNIYTTYFESTKTDSNAFIGALGLGSKSPFSYTDNFTVTAIKDGIRGVYSAFINNEGVPSIAKMSEEASNEPNGVEVKFAVNDQWDFSKFRSEAQEVYRYFKLLPVVSGASNWEFAKCEYEFENIIPGVHTRKNSLRSVAVMGNIAYPIEVPNAEQVLGELAGMLYHNLEIHFAIGEVDFQASREGLSYIPQTIQAIKTKLEQVNSQLSISVAEEADKITDLWQRAFYLLKMRRSSFWEEAVKKYIIDSKFPLLSVEHYGHVTASSKFTIPLQTLALKYNIQVHAFDKMRSDRGSHNRKSTNMKTTGDKVVPGFEFVLDEGSYFIKNDTNVGAVERAKYHFNHQPFGDLHRRYVFVLSKLNKTKPAQFDKFLKSIYNPPNVLLASELRSKERERSGLAKDVTILSLQRRNSGGYYREREMVWREADTSDVVDDTKTYYYLPLSGFTVESNYGMSDAGNLLKYMQDSGISAFNMPTIYGVRKGDIEAIKAKSNWINVEQFIADELKKPLEEKFIMSLVIKTIDARPRVRYDKQILTLISDKSPYHIFFTKLLGFNEDIKYDANGLMQLCRLYANNTVLSPEAEVQKYVEEFNTSVIKRYPMLDFMEYGVSLAVMADYINLVDTQKGV